MAKELRFIQREVVGAECFFPYETSIGTIYIISDAEAVTAILFSRPAGRRLKEQKNLLSDTAAIQISEFLSASRKTFDLPLKPMGTVFQKRVWEQLLEIPYGETRTYQDIAVALGNERAVRAVGQANNRNPISIVVPCHRVIGKNGKLIGYGGGLQIKDRLLSLEADVTGREEIS